MRNYLTEDGASLTADYTLAGRPFDQVITRLDSLLMVLKSCKARSCHKPWSVLHPDGKVATLRDAVHGDFDAFYTNQPKVSFSSCQLGYLIDAEGPQHVNSWDEGSQQNLPNGQQQSFQYHGDLSLWT